MSVEGLQGDSAPELGLSAGLSENVTESNSEDLGSEAAPKTPEPEKIAEKSPLDEKLSSKFAALSRKEKMLKQRETQVSQQMQQFQQQMEAMKAENAKLKQEYEQYRQGIKSSPLQKLQEEGLSFDDLTNMQLNEQNPTPEMLIKRTKQEAMSEIEKLRKELAEEKARQAEEKKRQEEEAETKTVEQYKSQLAEHVEANAEKYELITLNEASDLVFQVAEEYYNSEGRLLSAEEAADYTEKYLEEKAKKLLNAKKFQKQQAIPPKKAISEGVKKEASQTLSNDLSTEVPVGSSKKLTREQEIEEAAKLIRWEN